MVEMKRSILRWSLIVMAITLGVSFWAVVQAEEEAAPRVLMSKEKEPKEKGSDEVKMKTKTMSGDVSARGPSGVAIIYERDEAKHSAKEMWFPYAPEVKIKLTGYKEKIDIAEGDTVMVTYDEAEDGSKRILTGIRLLKKKPPEAEEVEEVEESGDK